MKYIYIYISEYLEKNMRVTKIFFDKNQLVGRSRCHVLRSERDAAEEGVPCEGPMDALASLI